VLEVLANDGVDALLAQVLADSGAVARVLGLPDGDRAATDLGHVGDLLRAGAPNGRASIASLLAVLDAPADPEAEPDIEGSVRDRRIETESESVQIMTAWVAKGLEFPVVCCPTLWRQPQAPPVIFTREGVGPSTLPTDRPGPTPRLPSVARTRRRATRPVSTCGSRTWH